MVRTVTVGLGLLISYAGARAADPAPPPMTPPAVEARARELVGQLGSEQFRDREAAGRELGKLGRGARGALQAGTRSGDPEVARRCRGLLDRLEKADRRARLDAFLADPEGKLEHDVPYWGLYRKVAGRGPAARRLYADVLKAHAPTLEQAEADPKAAGTLYYALASKTAADIPRRLGPPIGPNPVPADPVSVAALLLLGADPRNAKEIGTNQHDAGVALVTRGDPVAVFLTPALAGVLAGERDEPFRRLVFAWAAERSDGNSTMHAMRFLDLVDSKDGLPLALRVLRGGDQRIWSPGEAMRNVGRFGGKGEVDALEPFLSGEESMWRGGRDGPSTKSSDMALAAIIHLHGKPLADFGFAWAGPGLPEVNRWGEVIGFESERDRLAAVAKFAAAKEFPASARAAALIGLMYNADRNDAAFGPLLGDETVIAAAELRDGVKRQVQLRDLALAVCVVRYGESPADYGYQAAASRSAKDYYFATDRAREDALAKWRAWLKANPGKEKAAPRVGRG